MPVSHLNALELTYQDKVFSFEFAALDFSDPRKNRFKYKLEGFDEDWTEVGSNRRFTTYTNLERGDFVFRVLASNNDGIWNEEGLAVNIHIAPPYWKTWWFYTFCAGALLSIVTGLYSARIKRLHTENAMALARQENDS
jgi:hypothetical protein